MTSAPGPSTPVLRLRDAALGFGSRTLWSGLDLDVAPGEFVAVLGSNGTGKTSLLRAVLGLAPLQRGTVEVLGRPVRRGNPAVGYVPQEESVLADAPLRARDLVALGVDGHRWGIALPSRRRRDRVQRSLADAGAADLADRPVGVLSGGERQRVRIAQALATDPALLLCDEPLSSLDLRRQGEVAALVDARRRAARTAVLFVTHEVNPVLPYVDRVLYLAGGRFRLGGVDEVLTSASLSELYDAPVDVLRSGDRIVVAGVPDPHLGHHDPGEAP